MGEWCRFNFLIGEFVVKKYIFGVGSKFKNARIQKFKDLKKLIHLSTALYLSV